MIVVDANVVAHFFIEGGKTPLARSVREKDSCWIVPEIWRHECLNILVTSCLFAKLPKESALQIWKDAGDMLRGGIYEADMTEVLSSAVERSTTAYDAEYVVLAKAKGVMFVTEDQPLQKAFPDIALSMKAFLAGEGRPTVAKEPSGSYRVRRK